MSDRKKKIVNITSVGIGQANYVQKAGEAADQMIQAYKGVRYDSNGTDLLHQGRSLKQINNYKINPEYRDQNIKQQSGFDAELINEARKNKNSIMSGSDARVRTTDGIGKTNDQQYDLVWVDKDGRIIAKSGTQMKFLGVTKDGKYSVIEKLAKDSSWDRYDTSVEVPSDQYQSAVDYAREQAAKLREQAEHLEKLGKTETASKKLALADKYDNAAKRLKKSELTSEEAINARLDPEKFTAKEVVSDCTSYGFQAMKVSAFVGGVVSMAQNVVAVSKGEKEPEMALSDVVIDTTKAGATAFTVGSLGSGLKAAMHSSRNQFIRRVGLTNAPVMIVTGTIEIAQSLTRYAKGEIDTVELFNELGQKGVCTLSSSVGASIGGLAGSLLGPNGMIAGGILGGMAVYAVSSALYESVIRVLEEEKCAHDRRVYLEQLYKEAHAEMVNYRTLIHEQCEAVLSYRQQCFDTFFYEIENSVKSRNPDDSFRAFEKLNTSLGLKTTFSSFKEADDFMRDPNTVFDL